MNEYVDRITSAILIMCFIAFALLVIWVVYDNVKIRSDMTDMCVSKGYLDYNHYDRYNQDIIVFDCYKFVNGLLYVSEKFLYSYKNKTYMGIKNE